MDLWYMRRKEIYIGTYYGVRKKQNKKRVSGREKSSKEVEDPERSACKMCRPAKGIS